MRFRLLLLCLPVLLAACAKSDQPVRLDFIGISTLTSSNKTVQPNDTLTTRLYAVGNDNKLKRLTIKVTYDPGLAPITYPSPLTSYDPKNAPAQKEIIYLDSLIEPKVGDNNGHAISETLFVNQFSARATSGTELWQYTVTDVAGTTASRAYRLTTRKADSAAVFHSFTTVLRPVPRRTVVARGVRDRSRVFLNLQYGLLLPKYAVLNQGHSVALEANQNLVDLICVAGVAGTTVRLVAPANIDTICQLPARWTTRRPTGLRLTGLTSEQFGKAVDADFATSYNTSAAFAPNAFSTGALSKGQVLAFKIIDGTTERYGLLLISDLVLGSAPVLSCSVKVQK